MAYNKMHLGIIILYLILMQFSISEALPCDSCGNECANACGTKHFRTCCFNYLRKRTDPNALKLISNKRLIDFILLQGRAMYTQDELSRQLDERRAQQTLNNGNDIVSGGGIRSGSDNENENGALINFLDYHKYYG